MCSVVKSFVAEVKPITVKFSPRNMVDGGDG
jgi:hypothetical protein